MACQIRNTKFETRTRGACAMSQNVSLCLTAPHADDGQNPRGKRLAGILCWLAPRVGQGGERGKTDKNVCPTNSSGRSGALTPVDGCLPHASGCIIKSELNERSQPAQRAAAFPRIPRNSPSRRIISTKRKSRNEPKFGHNERAAKDLLSFESHRRRGAAEELGARAWGIERSTVTGVTSDPGQEAAETAKTRIREAERKEKCNPHVFLRVVLCAIAASRSLIRQKWKLSPTAAIDLPGFLPHRALADRMLGSLLAGWSGWAETIRHAGAAWLSAVFSINGPRRT